MQSETYQNQEANREGKCCTNIIVVSHAYNILIDFSGASGTDCEKSTAFEKSTAL